MSFDNPNIVALLNDGFLTETPVITAPTSVPAVALDSIGATSATFIIAGTVASDIGSVGLKYREQGDTGPEWDYTSGYINTPIQGETVEITGLSSGQTYEGAAFAWFEPSGAGGNIGPGQLLYFTPTASKNATEEAIQSLVDTFVKTIYSNPGVNDFEVQVGRNFTKPVRKISALIRTREPEPTPEQTNAGGIWLYPVQVFIQIRGKGTKLDKARHQQAFYLAEKIVTQYNRQRIPSIPKGVFATAATFTVDDVDREEIGLTSDQIAGVLINFHVWRAH